MRDEIINVVYVDEAIPLCSGHVPVDLGDDEFSGFGSSFGDVHRDTVTAVAVFVGHGNADKRDLNRDSSGPE